MRATDTTPGDPPRADIFATTPEAGQYRVDVSLAVPAATAGISRDLERLFGGRLTRLAALRGGRLADIYRSRRGDSLQIGAVYDFRGRPEQVDDFVSTVRMNFNDLRVVHDDIIHAGRPGAISEQQIRAADRQAIVLLTLDTPHRQNRSWYIRLKSTPAYTDRDLLEAARMIWRDRLQTAAAETVRARIVDLAVPEDRLLYSRAPAFGDYSVGFGGIAPAAVEPLVPVRVAFDDGVRLTVDAAAFFLNAAQKEVLGAVEPADGRAFGPGRGSDSLVQWLALHGHAELGARLLQSGADFDAWIDGDQALDCLDQARPELARAVRSKLADGTAPAAPGTTPGG